MKKWSVRDRFGNTIYLTEERWQHILESRPELKPFLSEFLETIETGRRKQDPLKPNEYRYFKQFNILLPQNDHLIAIVIFKTSLDENGNYIFNNFVVTGWAKFIISNR